MTIDGLPKILEDTINNILKSSMLSSWNIRGESTMLHLSIRFNMDAMGVPKTDIMPGITYRKVSPSQANRNKDRAVDWDTNKAANQVCDNICGDKKVVEKTVDIDQLTAQGGEITTDCAFKVQSKPKETILLDQDSKSVLPSTKSSESSQGPVKSSTVTLTNTVTPRSKGAPLDRFPQGARSQDHKQYGSQFSKGSGFAVDHSKDNRLKQCDKCQTRSRGSDVTFCEDCNSWMCYRCHHMHNPTCCNYHLMMRR